MLTSSALRILAAASAFASLTAAAPTKSQDITWQVTSLHIDDDASETPSKDKLSFELQRPDHVGSFDSCQVNWTNRTVPAGWQKCGDENDLSYKINTYGQIDGHTTLNITLTEISKPVNSYVTIKTAEIFLVATYEEIPEGKKALVCTNHHPSKTSQCVMVGHNGDFGMPLPITAISYEISVPN